MADELDASHVHILRNTGYVNSIKDGWVGNTNRVLTSKGDVIECKYLINAARQQSLDIAHEHGIGLDYDFFPIKGLYSLSDKKLDHIYKTLVYPVPIKGAYFLGVHSTLTVDGKMKIGPTVAPAFSLENYNGFENIKLQDAIRIHGNYTRMLFSSD